jgi:hypothetical protein
MFAAGLTGSSSHKSAFNEANPLLKFYYGNQIFLFIMCFLNESYFVLLAVKDDKDLYTASSLMGKKFDGPVAQMLAALNLVCLAACVLKQVQPPAAPLPSPPARALLSPHFSGSEHHAMAPRRQKHTAHRRSFAQRERLRRSPPPARLIAFILRMLHSAGSAPIYRQLFRVAAAVNAAT